MEASEQIKQFAEFLEKNYHAELLEKARKGEKFLDIDFLLLSKFNPDLSDLLLDQPEETLKAAELAIEQFDLEGDIKGFIMRPMNLPESSKILIKNIRSRDLNKLIFVEAVVRQKSNVRPQVTSARFECPSCGNTLNVLQLDTKFKEPTRCSCGRKGKFRLISKELVDAQSLVLEEAPENLDGGDQPKRVNALLKNDLVSPMSERKTNPGSTIVIVGIVKEVPIILRNGSQSTNFEIMVEANHIFAKDEDFSSIEISDEELEIIKTLASDKKVYKKIINSIAPSVYGHERIKEALVLQMMGGVKKQRDDGSVTRGDIHLLLIGDPGAGKSMMLKRIGKVAPKGRFISGKGVSGAGLTAAVVKDEFLSGWSLEAGALVLANKGVVCIDELDKMSADDRSAMHEALEGQTITISKANVQATLRCETTVLAAANPKFGRFDPYDTVANQIDLPPTLINRFDLIFPIKDIPDTKQDEILARFILSLHQKQETEKVDIDTTLLKKYFAYARQNAKPKLSTDAINELTTFYVQIRNAGKTGGNKSIPISARQLEGLVRLSEAYAKVRLDTKVTRKDAKKAISLLDFCLRQVAMDEKTGQIDIDRIATDMPSSKRNKIIQIKEIIMTLEGKLGKTIPLEDVIKEAKDKGLSEGECEEVIQRLIKAGDLFEPRRGFINRL